MRRSFFVFALAYALSVLPASVMAAPHFTLDSTPGTLPKTIVPLDYDINIVPDMKSWKFAGNEWVTIKVRKPTNTVVVNALNITISAATLDGVSASGTTPDPKHQIVSMNFPGAIVPGKHVLRLVYSGQIESSPQGLFHQEYTTANGKSATLLATQMESTDARRMFPGWDEPAFRARFQMTATVPRDFTAVSNMPIQQVVNLGADQKRVTFSRTPLMSSYLVVLCAGKFESVSGQANRVKINVYATEGKRESERFALASEEQLIPYFERYYGIKYPLPKIDLVAVPGGFGGAMENWGGMVFQDNLLLFDPKLQTESDKREVFVVIAHETSHQWNGDLTTMAWWDGLWLNEGFATWMMTKATDHFDPEWHVWTQFYNDRDNALYSDAHLTTHQINMPVRNETEAASVFDDISYTKAGNLLKMVEEYMGERSLRKALHNYFRAHEYGNTMTGDLWDAISAQAHTDVAAMADSWTNHPGFPVVMANASCQNGTRTITLSQQRYTNDPNNDPTVWQIPLNVELNAESGNSHRLLFNSRTKRIAGGSCSVPFLINGGGIGYYRTQYDPESFGLLAKNITNLAPTDRMELINDEFALIRANRSKVSDVFELFTADNNETNAYVLRPILGDVASMAGYERFQAGEAVFKTWEISFLKPMLARLGGWDGPSSDPLVVQTRTTLLQMLAEAGDKDTIAQAKSRFQTFLKNHNAYAPAMKNAVLGIA
ncbi:MAG: M1 family metallopeptidase, partial [Candidatus Eremiobacteraeota bacterium]|nr:M1 family metallopeptidase [Candidatus Eremiobacteraeota bacterium]